MYMSFVSTMLTQVYKNFKRVWVLSVLEKFQDISCEACLPIVFLIMFKNSGCAWSDGHVNKTLKCPLIQVWSLMYHAIKLTEFVWLSLIEFIFLTHDCYTAHTVTTTTYHLVTFSTVITCTCSLVLMSRLCCIPVNLSGLISCTHYAVKWPTLDCCCVE